MHTILHQLKIVRFTGQNYNVASTIHSWFSWSQLLYVHWTQSADTLPVDPSLSDALVESSSKLSEPSRPPHWPPAWVCGGVCRHSITCTVLIMICTLTRSTLLLTASMLIISPFSTSANKSINFHGTGSIRENREHLYPRNIPAIRYCAINWNWNW